MTFVQYVHHGGNVWVREDMKGKHRAHCLCYSCEQFKPDTEANCLVAERVYKACKEFWLLTPVWECAWFIEGKPTL